LPGSEGRIHAIDILDRPIGGGHTTIILDQVEGKPFSIMR